MKLKSMRRLFLALILVTAGCAGASSTPQSQAVPANSARPRLIVVYPFSVDPSDITLNQSIVQRAYRSVSGTDESAQQEKIAHDIAANICHQVADGLRDKAYNAVCQERGVPITIDNALVVDGEFTNVSEGNRLRRTVIGFGWGASTLDTSVYLFQKNGNQPSQQILAFDTHADSGKMPGAAVLAPVGVIAGAPAAAVAGTNVAVGAGKGYTSSMSSYADKTSAEILSSLTQYFVSQGWTTIS